MRIKIEIDSTPLANIFNIVNKADPLHIMDPTEVTADLQQQITAQQRAPIKKPQKKVKKK